MTATITASEVRKLLSDPRIFPDFADGLTDDTELVLDSLGLLWFLHKLKVEHGVHVEPSDEHLDQFTSIRRIVNYLHDLP